MSIVAAFDKAIFSSPTSRFVVLQLKTADIMIPQEARKPGFYRDHLIRFSAVGYDLPQTDAVKMELEGTWVNGKHGLQLQVESWREIIPPTIEGIRGYLASGLLKGIGEKTADAIVTRFGADSLNVLEKHPERLLEIRGITEERLEEIKTGYAESKAMRELMTLLAPFKVTPKTAMKIYQHFGSTGMELLRKSPFRLCQVPGFGFKRVDAIVQKSGGDPHDPMRIQGALFYALEKSRSEGGHLYMEAAQLLRSAMQLLNDKLPSQEEWIQQPEVERELEAMILTNVVVSNKGNIYLPHVFTQENETARKVVQMVLEVPPPVNLASALERIKGQLGINLSKRQLESVQMVYQHNLSIITGGPGTGKSTILKAVVETYHQLYPNNVISLAAPTGKASRRMAETTGINNAQTLHSLLGLHGEDSGWRKKQPLRTDLLVVDECSMLDMWLAHQMFSRLSPGTKVLLVGDADQLESVGAGNVFQELIDSGLVPVTVLNEIFRQAKGSLIAYNARSINEGNGELSYGADFAFIRADSQPEVAELIRSLYKKEAASTGIGQVQILSPFRSEGEASSQGMNEAIRDEINPAATNRPEVIRSGKLFRLNDRVMQIRNNYDIALHDSAGKLVSTGVFNGETGFISKIQSGSVTVNYDGRYADYPWESLDELELAYAMTIHKSQGSECDTVIIPMLAAHKILLSRNLLYTAVTRAKRRVFLVGQIKALYMAVGKARKGRRNSLLAERVRLYYHTQTCKGTPNETTAMRRAS